MFRNPNHLYGSTDLLVPYHLNFGQLMLDVFNQNKENVALINCVSRKEVTYGELLQQSMNFAVSLYELGVRKGQTVAVCSENRNEFFPALIGAWCVGATVTLINDSYIKDELRHILSIKKPNTMVASQTAYQKNKEIFKSSRFIHNTIIFNETTPAEGIWFDDLVSKVNVRYEDFQPAEVNGQQDVAAVLYSSGTTGLPKGVMLSHYNMVVCVNINKTGINGLPPTNVTITPWFHAMGLVGTLTSLYVTKTSAYIPKFDEKLFLDSIQRYKPLSLTIPPPVAILLSKTSLLKNYDVSSVEYIYIGAAPIDSQTFEELKKRLPNLKHGLQAYGMTETTLAVSKDSDEAPHGPRPSSVGPVVLGMVIKIVDIESREPLGPNQRGEICLKGPIIMLGYVGVKREVDFDSEGFLKTGDIGYYDNEKYLYIVDRLKELIKYKGFQVAPAELEAVLLSHPGIKDCGVIGKPDKSAGELPTAFVVTQPGVKLKEKEVQDYVADKVSNAKRLRGGVIFVDAIPKNPSGKILRKELRKMLNNKSKL